LIMCACALSENLRDDQLIVSFDHCNWWEAPRDEWGPRPARQPDATEQCQPNTNPRLPRRERAMQLTPAQVRRTLAQFEAQEIPSDHSAMPQLTRLFGEHTFFLDRNGLSIVEPLDPEQASGTNMCKVVCVADWNDADPPSLEPHEPVSTEIVVQLEPQH
jgi:hypothetical protein